MRTPSTLVAILVLSTCSSAFAQALGGAEQARPVQGDPGISSMVVIDQPEFRVLRNYAEPGATRRMHAHNDASYHVLVLVTGHLVLTIEGQEAIDVTPGQVMSLKAGVMHTFKNTADTTATMVEVFGKRAAGAAMDESVLAAAFSAATRR